MALFGGVLCWFIGCDSALLVLMSVWWVVVLVGLIVLLCVFLCVC